MNLPERSLIVRKEYADMILDGSKTWEMRSMKTNVRGRIGIIVAGSKEVAGEVNLFGCHEEPLREEDRETFFEKHRVEDLTLLEKWKYPWFLKQAKRYEKPIPYTHPKGAMIWVKH